MRTILAFILILTLTGCAVEPRSIYKLEGGIRLFMHEDNHYTMMVQEGSQLVAISIVVYNDANSSVRFIEDVPVGQPMWIEYSCVQCSEVKRPYSSQDILVRGVTFHVSAPTDINGAGWNHGKFGHGQTVVVQ